MYRDNSLEHHLSHNAAVLFSSILLSRLITVSFRAGLISEFIARLTLFSCFLVGLLLWGGWVVKTLPKKADLFEQAYRYSILVSGMSGGFLGLI